MKTLCVFCLLFTSTIFAQKKSNLFLAAEVGEKVGASVIYSYAIKGKFGIGVGAEALDFSSSEAANVSALVDVRYYHTMGKSTIFPLFQIGKYLYDYEATIYSTKISIKGEMHLAAGIGYSYALFKNGGGPFAAVKYRNIQVESIVNNRREHISDGNAVFSIGIRL